MRDIDFIILFFKSIFLATDLIKEVGLTIFGIAIFLKAFGGRVTLGFLIGAIGIIFIILTGKKDMGKHTDGED